jgi:hypothetical protein
MNDFIQMAVSKLGVSEQSAKSATGGVLDMIQKQVGGGDFSKLLGAVPGAADLLKSAPASGGSGGGGGLGGILGAASGLLGGKAGSILGAASMLEKSGLSLDKAGPFVSMLMDYFKGKAGNDLVSQILGKVPDLKKLVG